MPYDLLLTEVYSMLLSQKPSQPEMQKLVQPVVNLMNKTSEKTQGRRTDLFNHISALSEALQSLTWVVLSGDGAGSVRHYLFLCLGS